VRQDFKQASEGDEAAEQARDGVARSVPDKALSDQSTWKREPVHLAGKIDGEVAQP
jgi:hypothetical protein